MAMDWSVEEVETLRKLHADGLSAAAICKHMHPRFTRNAVIGKIHRMGLHGAAIYRKPKPNVVKDIIPGRDAGSISKAIHAIKRAKKKQQWREQVSLIPVDVTVAESPCGLMDLTPDTCRWPYGDPQDKDFHFCGGHAVVDLPYCAAHASLAYTQRR